MQRSLLRGFLARSFWGWGLAFGLSLMGLFGIATSVGAQAVPGSGSCEFVCNASGSVQTRPNTASCESTCAGIASTYCNASNRGRTFGWRCTGIVQTGGGAPTSNETNWGEAGSSCVRTALGPASTRSARLGSAALSSGSLGKDFSCVTGTDASFRSAHCVSGGCGSGSDYCCNATPPAPITGTGCAYTALNAITDATRRGTEQARLTALNSDLSTFACQRLCGSANTAANRGSQCITEGCPSGGDDVLCCKAGIGLTPPTTRCPSTGERASGSGRTGANYSLQLPPCVSDGNCQLVDILQTGVYFANFLFGLAGALFLAIFVYAGFKYVFFAYDSKQVGSAKDMMTNAMIGLLLMMAAGLFIRFVSGAIGGTSGQSQARCEIDHPGFSCSDIGAETATARAAAQGRGCVANACPGTTKNIMCCPAGAARPNP